MYIVYLIAKWSFSLQTLYFDTIKFLRQCDCVCNFRWLWLFVRCLMGQYHSTALWSKYYKNRAKFGKSMKLGRHAINTIRFSKSTRPRAKFDNMAAMAAIFKMAAKLKEDLINILTIWYITVVFLFFCTCFP